jgi:GNAT superfamily N-acetyltransferase
MDVVVRLAEPADLAAIVVILQDGPDAASAPETARHWIDRGAVRVAERDGVVLGIAVVEPTFFDNDFVELVRVGSAVQRQGVGRALLEFASSSRATPKVFTSTNLSNAPMQAVMRSLGWESAGIVYGLDEGDPELFYLAPALE